jgi:hypothetical protein
MKIRLTDSQCQSKLTTVPKPRLVPDLVPDWGFSSSFSLRVKFVSSSRCLRYCLLIGTQCRAYELARAGRRSGLSCAVAVLIGSDRYSARSCSSEQVRSIEGKCNTGGEANLEISLQNDKLRPCAPPRAPSRNLPLSCGIAISCAALRNSRPCLPRKSSLFRWL